MLTFGEDASRSVLEDLLERNPAIDCGSTVDEINGRKGSASERNAHRSFTPRCVDEFVSIARILTNLFDSSGTATLESNRDFVLPSSLVQCY